MVYEVIRKSKEFQKDFRLVNQIQDASVSTMSNIAEGFSRKGNKEFMQFLFISKSSSSEVQSHLYVALDQGYVAEKDFSEIYKQADLLSKMVSSFVKYLSPALKQQKITS
jgi:four helix bundle protein